MGVMKKPKLLIVDDDPQVRSALRTRLRRQFNVTLTESAEEALMALDVDNVFDVVVSDLTMGGMDGNEFFLVVQSRHPHLEDRFILHTAEPERAQAPIVVDKLSGDLLGTLSRLPALVL